MPTNQFNIDKVIRPAIESLKPYASARDEFKDFDQEMVFLDANENPFENGVNRYPDPYQSNVKTLLSNQKGIPPNQILLGNGSDEVLDLIFRAFCEPNQDNVITLPPTYGMYEVLANLNAVELQKINLSEDFQPRIPEIIAAANQNSKVLFLCSPNNPTANSFNKNNIEKLLNEFNGLVVIDEAYIDFSEGESWLSRLDDFPNLIVTQTLSKAYGMAGIRLGICYASMEIISILNKIKPPYNINELSQQMAVKQLSNLNLVKQQVKDILIERTKLSNTLKSVNFVEKIYSSDANFLLVKVDDANMRYKQLVDLGIVVRNRTTQYGCENCLRFTVGTTEENEKLINTLKGL
ncbi:histidinol-phosphate transaminase [Flavobacteriaceae bacterium AU392]|nr:histidinol-phosphate transaminase [Flavobacteriaceae bacterium]RKM85549.1 histidinol-phosphate transaminase [Flavobacteriaceae bacterium AU392]